MDTKLTQIALRVSECLKVRNVPSGERLVFLFLPIGGNGGELSYCIVAFGGMRPRLFPSSTRRVMSSACSASRCHVCAICNSFTRSFGSLANSASSMQCAAEARYFRVRTCVSPVGETYCQR